MLIGPDCVKKFAVVMVAEEIAAARFCIGKKDLDDREES